MEKSYLTYSEVVTRCLMKLIILLSCISVITVEASSGSTLAVTQLPVTFVSELLLNKKLDD